MEDYISFYWASFAKFTQHGDLSDCDRIPNNRRNVADADQYFIAAAAFTQRSAEYKKQIRSYMLVKIIEREAHRSAR